MQNVGEQQFLVLLLVIETDLDDRHQCLEIVRGSNQRRHRGIDVSAIFGNFGGVGPGDEAALRARLPRSRRDIIRVEQIGEALVERFIVRRKWPQQKLLEKPRHVRPMPFGRAGFRHRLDDLVFGDNSAARRSVSPRTA